MFTRIRWMGYGVATGIAAHRVWLELQKPACDQFPWLRRQMNRTINPWLMEHGIPGSARAEIGTLEHIGRKSGTTFFTPVHPTIHDDVVLIPAPLGVGSQWAQNVLATGRARLQLHETLYELDRPEMISITEAGLVAPQIAAPFDHMGWRYLRLHLVTSVPGTFVGHGMSLPAEHGAPLAEPPLEGAYEIPVEPRMVGREVTPA